MQRGERMFNAQSRAQPKTTGKFSRCVHTEQLCAYTKLFGVKEKAYKEVNFSSQTQFFREQTCLFEKFHTLGYVHVCTTDKR